MENFLSYSGFIASKNVKSLEKMPTLHRDKASERTVFHKIVRTNHKTGEVILEDFI